ncbi:glycosyltransferase family 4 protein [Thermoflavimicrobium daqui]|uniref:Glycosyl transferase n=1 Tax=Thermoflavimicrobium daqui TaxID=2137476 RepID=A0A364K5D8_9BACL|nr:glycosyltransferase family 4 protein [Thermoflavimicrobium daqui]RAL24572.1 glycosyl transferase [Thermoflavimicrobium daqui]
MRQKKVMIFSSVHPYDDTRIFHKQAVSLVQAGYEVELHAVADFEEKMEKGVRIVGVKRHAKKLKRLENGRILFERALNSGADIFHFHDPELLPWGARIAKKTKKPVIYDSHEDLPKQIHTKPWIPEMLRGPLSRIVHRVEKGFARQLAAVITATEPIAEQFRGAKNVTVVKNYPLPMPKVEREDNERNLILYVGGVSYLRGYREMIQMMDYIPAELRAELHFIGPLQHIAPQDQNEQELKQKNIYLHGRIPFDDVKRWLAKGKVGLVCLHPSQNYLESLPIKMFEYMAAGLPQIASDFPMWKEIIETSECGFTADPLNPEEIAEKVTQLLSKPKLHQKLSESGRRAHEEIYNWQVEEKKLLALYGKLLKER